LISHVFLTRLKISNQFGDNLKGELFLKYANKAYTKLTSKQLQEEEQELQLWNLTLYDELEDQE
jgi:hypothetical protein